MIGIIDSNQKIISNNLILNFDAAQKRSYSGSGTNVNDLSFSKNNLILINGVSYSTNNGGCFVMDGTDDIIDSTLQTGILGAANRTYCIWFYPTTMTSGQNYSLGYIGQRYDKGAFEILIADNNITGHFWGSGNAFGVASGKTLLNNFTYVCMSYDGTNVYIYVDGVLKGQQAFSLNTRITTYYLLEPTSSAYFKYFKGNIFAGQIYSSCLNSTEILQNYNSIKSRFL